MTIFSARILAGVSLVTLAAQGEKGRGEIPPWRADPKIREAIARIDPRDLESTVRALVACGTRHSATDREEKDAKGEPPARGIGAARAMLVSRLQQISKAAGGRLEVREDWVDLVSRNRLPDGKARGANVIARLPGTEDPDRIIVISGHYDSINRRFDATRGGAIDIVGDAPGADDDGSGTAVAVACAKALADQKFPATIEFACYTAEEQGLLGSKAHAEALKSAGKRVEANLNNDIVGASVGPDGVKRSGYIRVFSSCPNGLDSPSRNLARHAADVAALYLAPFEAKLVFRKDRYGRGGDHTSFEAAGFPGIRFTEPRENYAHQHEDVREEKGIVYGDRIEFLDFEYLANVAKLNAALAAELASAPPAPRGVRVNGALRNDTGVTWSEAADGDAAKGSSAAAGHEAVVRETTAPRWERVHPLAAGGRATVAECLDDVVIGVRAVGRGGHRSFATVPADPDSRPASAPSGR